MKRAGLKGRLTSAVGFSFDPVGHSGGEAAPMVILAVLGVAVIALGLAEQSLIEIAAGFVLLVAAGVALWKLWREDR